MRFLLAAAFALGLGMSSNGAQAVGCLSGAVAGGVAGHYAGHHAVLGAAAGCYAGHKANLALKQRRLEQQRQSMGSPHPVTH